MTERAWCVAAVVATLLCGSPASAQDGADEVDAAGEGGSETAGDDSRAGGETELTDEEAEAAYLAAMYGSDDAPATEGRDEERVRVPPVEGVDYLGYAGLGVGVLGIVGGLVTRMLAPRAFDRASRREGEALELGSAVLFAAGGALALAGLIVIYVRFSEREAALYGGLELHLGLDGVSVSGRF